MNHLLFLTNSLDALNEKLTQLHSSMIPLCVGGFALIVLVTGFNSIYVGGQRGIDIVKDNLKTWLIGAALMFGATMFVDFFKNLFTGM